MLKPSFLSLAGMALIALSTAASATTVAVSPGPGTPLQDAINAAAPGTKILLDEGGTYTETIVINKSITVQPSHGFASIDASSTNAAVAVDIESDKIKLKNLTVRGGTAEGVHVGPHSGISLSGMHPEGPVGLTLQGSTGVKVQGGQCFGSDTAARLTGIPAGAKVKFKNVNVIVFGSNPDSVGMRIEDSGAGALLGKGGIQVSLSKYASIGGNAIGLLVSNSSGILVKGQQKPATLPSGGTIFLYGGGSAVAGLSLDANSTENKFMKVGINAGGNGIAVDNAGSGNCAIGGAYVGSGTLPQCL